MVLLRKETKRKLTRLLFRRWLRLKDSRSIAKLTDHNLKYLPDEYNTCRLRDVHCLDLVFPTTSIQGEVLSGTLGCLFSGTFT